jgi:hypothetical protein
MAAWCRWALRRPYFGRAPPSVCVSHTHGDGGEREGGGGREKGFRIHCLGAAEAASPKTNQPLQRDATDVHRSVRVVGRAMRLKGHARGGGPQQQMSENRGLCRRASALCFLKEECKGGTPPWKRRCSETERTHTHTDTYIRTVNGDVCSGWIGLSVCDGSVVLLCALVFAAAFTLLSWLLAAAARSFWFKSNSKNANKKLGAPRACTRRSLTHCCRGCCALQQHTYNRHRRASKQASKQEEEEE